MRFRAYEQRPRSKRWQPVGRWKQDEDEAFEIASQHARLNHVPVELRDDSGRIVAMWELAPDERG